MTGRYRFHVVVVGLVALVGILVSVSVPPSTGPSARRAPLNRRTISAMINERALEAGRGEEEAGAAQEQYDQRAWPHAAIDPAQQQNSYFAFLSIAKRPGGKKTNWQEVGPFVPYVPVNYTGRLTTNSGRVTALAVSPSCHASACKILVGAAGGGVWAADNAMASNPNWHPSSDGIPSNAIGAILFDPTDRFGRTVYAGTGEPSGSSDSEAGVGLYKSTDSGKSWSLVPGSWSVAVDRGIGAIAVDPNDSRHILLGTAVGRHGSSSVNGGRFTPPASPQIGLYESFDGGATFALKFSRPSDSVDPTSATGGDFFRGGVSTIEADRTGLARGQATRFYFSMYGYGVYRLNPDGTVEQVFASAAQGTVATSSGARTEFALAPGGGRLRIYVGDTNGTPANLYRVDDANVPAATLTNGVTNPGWLLLSSPSIANPGYGSWNFCGSLQPTSVQCSYDMVVVSPRGYPDHVWLGGQMHYEEIFTAHPPSNGRAVLRSTNAGVSFTDMTNDTQSPPLGMHPDQHAIAFAGGNPNIAFIGSDGGVVRTSGSFVDFSADCASRGISGNQLIRCLEWLAAVPSRIDSLNEGLRTLQFQSVSLNRQNPLNDLIGGTQDNGTWVYSGQGNGLWFETINGDGGQSGIDAVNPNVRVHSFFDAQHDVNFNGNDPLGWNWVSDPFFIGPGASEPRSFYPHIIADPAVAGSMFVGLDFVWRTKDSGGPRAFLEQYCNEYFGDYANRPSLCGNWVRLGPAGLATNTAIYGAGKNAASYVVAIERAPTDNSTMWVGTRRGRVFVSTNADAAAPASVAFTRIDTIAQPQRFVSGIAVDPDDPNHAFVSFSGYDAYTPATPGHVFEVTYNPVAHTATWTNISHNLGDQPITDVAYDNVTGELFASTDFGVALLEPGAVEWVPAAGSLPAVATYGLTINSPGRVLYAATHGRGIWKLDLSK